MLKKKTSYNNYKTHCTRCKKYCLRHECKIKNKNLYCSNCYDLICKKLLKTKIADEEKLLSVLYDKFRIMNEMRKLEGDTLYYEITHKREMNNLTIWLHNNYLISKKKIANEVNNG